MIPDFRRRLETLRTVVFGTEVWRLLEGSSVSDHHLHVERHEDIHWTICQSFLCKQSRAIVHAVVAVLQLTLITTRLHCVLR